MAARGFVSLQAYVPRGLKKKLDEEAREQTKSRGERLAEILRTHYPRSKGSRR